MFLLDVFSSLFGSIMPYDSHFKIICFLLMRFYSTCFTKINFLHYKKVDCLEMCFFSNLILSPNELTATSSSLPLKQWWVL